MASFPFLSWRSLTKRSHFETSDTLVLEEESIVDLGDIQNRAFRLLAKEDIYWESDSQRMLLIRSGCSVADAMLPKLVSLGVSPEQFEMEVLSNDEISLAEEDTSIQPMQSFLRRRVDQPSQGVDTTELKPAESRFTPDAVKQERLYRDIFLCMESPQDVKTVLNALQQEGITSDCVQTLIGTEHLDWALRRSKPSVLFLNLTIQPGHPGLGSLIQSLKRYAFLKHLVVLVDLPLEKAIIREKLLAVAQQVGVDLLFKPLQQEKMAMIVDHCFSHTE